MKHEYTMILWVCLMVLAGCTSDADRRDSTIRAMAAMICEGSFLDAPQVQKDHVNALKGARDSKLLVAADRAELVPQVNATLEGAGIDEKDIGAFAAAINQNANRGHLVDAMAFEVNAQCHNLYLDRNEDIQYAIATLVVLYADPSLVR
jgi:ribonuclease HII